jgi:glycosyltransferase involved in cell wall biosynthesis
MRISVVLCTRNRPEWIRSAVASVIENDHPEFELVIIDQSASSATREQLDDYIEKDERVRYFSTDRSGLSPARNLGVARSRGEIIAFTDDDCVVPSDWLKSIERVFDRESDADLVFGRVGVPDELSDRDGVVPAFEIDTDLTLNRSTGIPLWGMGANFAARRRLFDRVGLFDDALGAGCRLLSGEDRDFQYRVHVAGLTCYMTPDVELLHYGHRDPSQWERQLYEYGFGLGAFYMKHVRCGDRYAAWRLARSAVGQVVLILKPPFRRWHHRAYLSGIVRGAAASLRVRVSRARRLYMISLPSTDAVVDASR